MHLSFLYKRHSLTLHLVCIFIPAMFEYDDHSSLSSTTAVQKWIISYTWHHFTPHRRYELNKLTSLPMCGFIAQLVEQRTGNAEGGHGFESRWSPDFFRFLHSNCLNWKIYCDDHSSLSSYVWVCWIICFSHLHGPTSISAINTPEGK